MKLLQCKPCQLTYCKYVARLNLPSPLTVVVEPQLVARLLELLLRVTGRGSNLG